MSDPVTNAEVEDVLSSIRRLVSEDKRQMPPRAVAQPGSEETSAAKPVNDRLVLTPSLRVEETQVQPEDTLAKADNTQAIENEPLQAAQDHGAAAHAEDYSDDPYSFDDDTDEEGDITVSEDDHASREVVTAPPALETGSDASFEADQGNAVPEEDFIISDDSEDRVLADLIEDAVEAEEPETNGDFDSTEDLQDLSEPPLEQDVDQKTANLTAKIAQLETAIGNISDNWEPDGSTEDDYAGTEAPAMAWEDDKDVTPSQSVRHEADYSEAEDVKEPEPFDDMSANDQPTDAPETLNAATPVTDFSKVTGAFALHSTARVDTAESDEAEADTAAIGRAALELGTDEQLIDEEALRDLVSEIVREELQGALGERITRNVRKLVRREIHRALTAQDLE